MDKKIQDLAWACLPKEVRANIKAYHRENKAFSNKSSMCNSVAIAVENIFGQHNLVSDTEPEEMLFYPRKDVQEYYTKICKTIDKSLNPDVRICSQGTIIALKSLFGSKCLSDTPDSSNLANIGKDELEQTSVQATSKPKFKVGDKVRIIIEGWSGDPISEVVYYDEGDNTYKLDALDCEEGGLWVKEWQIESYTEESRNQSQNIANCDKSEGNQLKDNMEEKELDLRQLLKDCKNETFYSLIEGEAKFKQIEDIEVKCGCFKYHFSGYLSGRSLDGACLLYPSRALYEKYPLDAKKAWGEWASERKPKRWKPSLGDEYFSISGCAK
ncbi:MAG: hypothetical protein K2G90_05940, partial [Muribaculaceae bacterium]|nr:hypothetical protein [Muribaculaceae bacterium]